MTESGWIFVAMSLQRIEERARARGLSVRIESPLVAPATPVRRASRMRSPPSCKNTRPRCPRLVSGAGHDAVALAEVTEVAMLLCPLSRED